MEACTKKKRKTVKEILKKVMHTFHVALFIGTTAIDLYVLLCTRMDGVLTLDFL